MARNTFEVDDEQEGSAPQSEVTGVAVVTAAAPSMPAAAPDAPIVAGSVSAADGGGTSPPPGSAPDDVGSLPPPTRLVRWIEWIVVLAFGVPTIAFIAGMGIGGLSRGWDSGLAEGFMALSFGFGLVAVGLLVLQLVVGQDRYGVLRPLIGTDRRFSTSLTQVGLWTLVVVTTFAYLLGRVVFEDQAFARVIPSARWDEYLLLLGGPFSAAVLAKGITSFKVQQGTLQKSESPTTELRQVVQGDQGAADMVDAQYLLFNVVAMGYVIAQLAATNRLPEIPAPLLALTGATAAAYVANKTAERNRPTITSVSPTTVYAEDRVIVFGTNFDPADRTDERRRITVTLTGVTERLYPVKSSESAVVFAIPSGAAAGEQTVTVTSTAGVDSQPVAIRVLARVPVLTGSDRDLLPGVEVTLNGTHLGEPGGVVPVSFGTRLAQGRVSDDSTAVTVTVPRGVQPGADGTVEVAVRPAGRAEAKALFDLEVPSIRHAARATGATLTLSTSGTAGKSTPRVTVNDRAANVSSTRSGFTVTIPDGVDGDAELRLVVTDELGRQSLPYDLPVAD